MSLHEYQKHFYQQLRSGHAPVYSGNFIGGITERLDQIFSQTRKHLGVLEFERLASEFAQTTSFFEKSCFHIGDAFPNWVKQNAPLSSEIQEMMTYELMIHQLELNGEIPIFNSKLLEDWLNGDSSVQIRLHKDCQFLEEDSGYRLIGISILGQAHALKLTKAQAAFLQMLETSSSYLDWIEKISPETDLEQEETLVRFMRSLIEPGWLCPIDDRY